jgi:tetratricopeptide (TPR) repeat protein
MPRPLRPETVAEAFKALGKIIPHAASIPSGAAVQLSIAAPSRLHLCERLCMRRINRLLIFACMTIMLLAARGHAQDEAAVLGGESAELCVNAPLAGAAKVFVVVRENDDVQLVGMKGRAVVWKKGFPLREDVNKAKTYVECKGRAVELHSQLPFSAAELIQLFSWDGQRLRYKGTRHEDPSAEFIEEMLRAAESGDTKTLSRFLKNDPAEGEVDVMYPYAYINGQLFSAAIKRGHNAATRLFKLGRARDAALRLQLMFDVTAQLNRIVSADEVIQRRPDGWIQAWTAQEMRPGDYVYALNDYGYFLQRSGENGLAVNIFSAVIAADAERAAAHLNLADSLWALDKKDEARSHYKTYRQLMAAAKRGADIPARVAERLG